VTVSWLAAACVFLLPVVAPAQALILQIKVLEGEGVVHAPGSRATRPLTVEVTDETGKPVEHATVSLHLPDDGPGGTFLNGLRTDVGLTDCAGRFVVPGVQWNRQPGRFQIRILASLEQAHAGMLSSQYIGEQGGRARTASAAPSQHPSPVARSASNGRTKWIVIAALLAAGATAGALNGARSSAATPAPPAPPAPTLTIGVPTITVGKP
jgi:hypothetical protein